MAKHAENKKYDFLFILLIFCVFIVLGIITYLYIIPYISINSNNGKTSISSLSDTSTDANNDILEHTSTTYKILYGSRVAIPTSLEYRVTKAVGQTVKLPAALQSGDDSWLMLKHDGTLYFETRCEVGEPGALKAEDIVMQVQDNATRDIIYLKVAKKVYIENGQPVN